MMCLSVRTIAHQVTSVLFLWDSSENRCSYLIFFFFFFKRYNWDPLRDLAISKKGFYVYVAVRPTLKSNIMPALHSESWIVGELENPPLGFQISSIENMQSIFKVLEKLERQCKFWTCFTS